MLARLERSTGNVHIGFKRRENLTVLGDLYQQGCGKVRIVGLQDRECPQAVIINTSGGMTDGDRFSSRINWDAGTCAMVTTQAAERFYKVMAGRAGVKTTLEIGDDACGLWLPQETIMFDGAAYDRITEVNLGKDARMVAIETSIFGRHAMNERIGAGTFSERWQIRQAGRLIFADAFARSGDIDTQLTKPVIANGARALSTIVALGPDAAAMRDATRGIISQVNITGGATCLGPLVVIRVFAKTSHELRKAIIPVLEKLIEFVAPDRVKPAGLPRIWSL